MPAFRPSSTLVPASCSRGRFAAATCVLAALLGLSAAGCLDEAPRGNPLDPLANNFADEGGVAGRVTGFYEPLEPIAGAEVRLTPGPYLAETDAAGRFAVRGLPSGTYLLAAAPSGFAGRVDTVAVEAGRTTPVDLRLNGLPTASDVALTAVHISRWWPQEDLYLLDVQVAATDPDGQADVTRVWLEVPDWAFADTLAAGRAPGTYAGRLEERRLPGGRLHALLGRTVQVWARDRVGAVGPPVEAALTRVIDAVPVAVSPQGLETVADPRPTLVWDRLRLPFDVTFEVEVVRVDNGILTTTAVVAGLPAEATSAQPPEALAPGSYIWTVTVVDEYGNRSRSKEAGFVVP